MRRVWNRWFMVMTPARSILALLIVALLTIPLFRPSASADGPSVIIEARVWQDVENDQNIYISARPVGGSWRTLGTRALALDDGQSFAGRYRHGDIALALSPRGDAQSTVELRVSQGMADGRDIFFGARARGESWLRVGMIALRLEDGFSPKGRYRYGDIRLAIPLSSTDEIAACSNGVAVSEPEQRPDLVRDCAVLLQERDTLTGGGEGLNWSVERPVSDWHGITVGGQPPRVTEISVRSILQGRIPPGLARLERLKTLRLYDNDMTGEIPREIGLLSELQFIHFSDTNLTGPIPPELGQLSDLRRLWLLYSQFGGEIPAEVAAIPFLWFVDLRGNRFSGEIPIEFARLGLSILNLGGNRLSGEIPTELAQARSLTSLSLGANMLTGEIPPILGSLQRLNFLSLSNNSLSGEIPVELGNLTELWDVKLHNNQLTGEIPAEVAALPKLNSISFFNNQLTGCVPTDLWSKLATIVHDDGTPVGVVTLPWCDAVQVSVAVPPLNRTLIEACKAGSVFTDVTSNTESLNDCAALLEAKEILEGTSGDLNWTAETPISDWTGVWFEESVGRVRGLGLSGQALGGRIPAILANLTDIEAISLRDNQLIGEIPAELGHLGKLTRLRLDRNQLTGSIPPELGALAELDTLSLAENQLGGSIPAELGQLGNLRELSLQDNRLDGEIPSALARLNGGQLNLSGNRLSGLIPRAFAEVDRVWEWWLWLSGNQFDGCLPNILGTRVVDLEMTGLSYCECPTTWERSYTSEPGLSLGADGIPFFPHTPTESPGTYRVTFQLVVDLPEGGDFGLESKFRAEEGQILVRIIEEKSDSYLTIDPFTGAEFERSVTEGPADCEVSISEQFDKIVESARVQSLAIPLEPNGYPTMYLLQPVDGGRTYNIWRSDYLVADVPEGMRLTLEDGGGICENPGGCYPILHLRDEASGSYMAINGSTGTERRRVLTEKADERRLTELFDSLAASIRREEPPYLRPSCEATPTVSDCEALLAAAEILAVEAELNWNTELDLRYWRGVTVDPWTGQVVAVKLSNGDLDGQVPGVLSRLSSLEELALGANDLTGSIPPELGRLTNLKYLRLGSNELSGEIPSELGNLDSLERLHLYGNNLEGCIPTGLERFEFIIHEFSNPGLRHCGSG